MINPPGASASFTLTEGGALPAGLSLAANGVISGRASAAAPGKSYTIRASGSSADVKGQTAEMAISLEVKNVAVLDSIDYGQGSGTLVLIKGEALTAAQLSGLEVKTTPPGLGADYSIKKKGDTRALSPADFKDATGLDFDPNTGRLSLEGASLKSGQAAAVTYEVTAVPNASKGSRASAPSGTISTEITIRLAERFSVTYAGEYAVSTGPVNNPFNTGPGDGTELSKAYNLTFDPAALRSPYGPLTFEPTFTPAEAKDGAVYAIQAVNPSTGADLSDPGEEFNTKFPRLRFFVTDPGRTGAMNRTGQIGGRGSIAQGSPKTLSAYKITITPKAGSGYYGTKVVFIKVEIKS